MSAHAINTQLEHFLMHLSVFLGHNGGDAIWMRHGGTNTARLPEPWNSFLEKERESSFYSSSVEKEGKFLSWKQVWDRVVSIVQQKMETYDAVLFSNKYGTMWVLRSDGTTAHIKNGVAAEGGTPTAYFSHFRLLSQAHHPHGLGTVQKYKNGAAIPTTLEEFCHESAVDVRVVMEQWFH